VAESGTYNLNTGAFKVTGCGQASRRIISRPAQAEGTKQEMTLTGAVVTYGEPGSLSPRLWADHLLYVPGDKISGQNASLGIGDQRLFPVAKFEQSLAGALLPTVTARAGYGHNLGGYLDLDVRVPIWPGIQTRCGYRNTLRAARSRDRRDPIITTRTDRTSPAISPRASSATMAPWHRYSGAERPGGPWFF